MKMTKKPNKWLWLWLKCCSFTWGGNILEKFCILQEGDWLIWYCEEQRYDVPKHSKYGASGNCYEYHG